MEGKNQDREHWGGEGSHRCPQGEAELVGEREVVHQGFQMGEKLRTAFSLNLGLWLVKGDHDHYSQSRGKQRQWGGLGAIMTQVMQFPARGQVLQWEKWSPCGQDRGSNHIFTSVSLDKSCHLL